MKIKSQIVSNSLASGTRTVDTCYVEKDTLLVLLIWSLGPVWPGMHESRMVGGGGGRVCF